MGCGIVDHWGINGAKDAQGCWIRQRGICGFFLIVEDLGCFLRDVG